MQLSRRPPIGVRDQVKADRKAWAVMLAAFVASIVVAINQFKVPPVMQALMTDLGVDMVTGGWFMSVISIATLLLAIPSAFLIMRLGFKIAGITALSCTMIGSLLGALAHDPAVLLLGRVIEGGGTGLMAITAPAAISAWFEPQDRGLPMGIWAAWVPIGNVIMFNLAQPLLEVAGWQALWWFGALLALLALILYGLIVTNPPGTGESEPAPPGSVGRMLFNPLTWLLAVSFGAFAFSLLGYNTWAPSFLITRLDIQPSAANRYASLLFLAAIPSNIFAGWLLSRLNNRYRLLPIAFAITSILYVWSFQLANVAVVMPYMLALGFASNIIPAATFTLAPETMAHRQFAGLALGIVSVGSSVGALIGPPILASILRGNNWSVGSICLVLVMGFGTMVSILAWQRLSKL